MPEHRHVAEVHLEGLEHLDACLAPAVLDAVASQLGYEVALLRKASDEGEGIDPMFPDIYRLIELARNDWDRWGERLVRELLELQERGQLFPMTPENERLLMQLLGEHELAIILRWSGKGRAMAPRGEYTALVERGLVSPAVSMTSWVEIAYRLGRGADLLQALEAPPETTQDLEALVRKAMETPLTPADRHAIEHVKRRGAIYMRRPAVEATGELYRVLTEEERLLTDDELGRVRRVTEAAVEQRQGMKQLERKLWDALQGTTLNNNVARIARTELLGAHHHGAYRALKEQAAKIGQTDPWVFKFARAGACVDCLRIWGKPTDPQRYRLSELEAWEAEGANFRKPRKEWRACIGPIHPNCTEGPLLLYRERVVRGANALAERIARSRR